METVVPERIGFSTSRLMRINTMLQGYVDRKELPGMLSMIARKGKVVHQEKFGWMDIENGTPMAYDAIFQMASMTKAVTSIAIMLLYEEGAFSLNMPVSKFIPAFKDIKVLVKETPEGPDLADLECEITFRHLFTHTAGLSYGSSDDDPVDKLYRAMFEKYAGATESITLKKVIEDIAKLPIAFQPGTSWRYSMAIDVLGYLIEVISGIPLHEFFTRRIFEPLGMVDTAFYVPSEKQDRLALIYEHVDGKEGLQRNDNPRPDALPIFLSPGGGLFSTLHDYARFAQMLVNGGELDGVRLLSPSTVKLMELNQAPSAAMPYRFNKTDIYHEGYGYGIGMRVLVDVAQSGLAGSMGEFGWDGAFNTYFWIDRAESLFGLLLMQHGPNNYYPVAQQFKQLTYVALVKDQENE